MHKDSVFKYLLKTDKEFYMNGQAFLFIRGKREMFYKCDLSMYHYMYHTHGEPILGFSGDETRHIAMYYDHFKFNDCGDNALVWNPSWCRWDVVDNNKLFLEYCRSDVQL